QLVAQHLRRSIGPIGVVALLQLAPVIGGEEQRPLRHHTLAVERHDLQPAGNLLGRLVGRRGCDEAEILLLRHRRRGTEATREQDENRQERERRQCAHDHCSADEAGVRPRSASGGPPFRSRPGFCRINLLNSLMLRAVPSMLRVIESMFCATERRMYSRFARDLSTFLRLSPIMSLTWSARFCSFPPSALTSAAAALASLVAFSVLARMVRTDCRFWSSRNLSACSRVAFIWVVKVEMSLVIFGVLFCTSLAIACRLSNSSARLASVLLPILRMISSTWLISGFSEFSERSPICPATCAISENASAGG